ncbi:O-antigen ligase family protein [uncultured Devosia sp.]|uniref:O-antigen ligase family protein n=1 Tax=uncultured Devosia sp. TaxID=211434 RepID=UPI0035C97E9E
MAALDLQHDRQLAERRDLLFFSIVLFWFLFDASNMSYWRATSEATLLTYERPFDRIEVALTFGLQGLYLLANLKLLWRMAMVFWPVIALATLCPVSTLWSYDPPLSFTSGLSLVTTTGFIATAVFRHSSEQVIQRMTVIMTVLVAINLVSLLVPSLSFMTAEHRGAFRGWTNHKNTFGPLLALHIGLLLVQCTNRDFASRTRLLFLALMPIELAALALTQSSNALIGVVVVLVLFTGGNVLKRASRGVWTLVWVIGATLLVLTLQFASIDDLFALVGRESNLTGRTQIWELALRFADQRFVLGWGYKALPLTELLSTVPRADGGARFIVGSTHNSYIEIYAGLGLIGCCAYVAAMTWLAGRNWLRPKEPYRRLGFLVLGAYLTMGYAESTMGLHAGVGYCLLLACMLPSVIKRQPAFLIRPSTASPLQEFGPSFDRVNT